ncbi:MAG TPA: 4-oxalocrotonate tautomerase family protein [Azospirillaceae bacterium]|nr:4-oxalocrotonate tautomerase family protein [Azospirillaceae bacterium]
MPIVTVRQFTGRTDAQKQALAQRITAAVREIYGPTPQKVQVLIEEVPLSDWFSEGEYVRRPDGQG